MKASELYALSQNDICKGMFQCHWCLAPCSPQYKHDDVRFLPFVKSAQLPKNPAGHYCCAGCWRWRMAPVTVNFPGGGYLDRQNRSGHSWFFNRQYAIALQPNCRDWLCERLLSPTEAFVLSITTNGERMPNFIHLMLCNNVINEATAETEFEFTIDLARFTYSVYELEEGLKHGPNGKSAGVRELLRTFEQKKTPMQIMQDSTKPLREVVPPRQAGRPHESSEKQNMKQLKNMKRFLR